MPYGDPDGDDPMELVGAFIPAGERAEEEMADCFIEEFALMGFDEGRILRLFQQPAYRATHRLWCERGEGWVKRRIAAVKARFARADARAAGDDAWNSTVGADVKRFGCGWEG